MPSLGPQRLAKTQILNPWGTHRRWVSGSLRPLIPVFSIGPLLSIWLSFPPRSAAPSLASTAHFAQLAWLACGAGLGADLHQHQHLGIRDAHLSDRDAKEEGVTFQARYTGRGPGSRCGSHPSRVSRRIADYLEPRSHFETSVTKHPAGIEMKDLDIGAVAPVARRPRLPRPPAVAAVSTHPARRSRAAVLHRQSLVLLHLLGGRE